MNVQQEIHIEKILEYDDLFLGEDFDIEATLCKYSRELIIRLVNCLGLTYEKAYLPDANNPFFSSLTPKVQDLDYRLSHFFVIICFFMVIFVPFDYLNIRRSGTFPLFCTTQDTIFFVLIIDTFAGIAALCTEIKVAMEVENEHLAEIPHLCVLCVRCKWLL